MAGGSKAAKEHPFEYIFASLMAAAINYPLWRASAVGQSGFRVASIPIAGFGSVPPSILPYIFAFAPPYKGMVATVLGMTWARAAIFWGSDRGRELLKSHYDAPNAIATVVPPLVVSTAVQCINMPIVRASITLQNPQTDLPNINAALRHIYAQHGLKGLWHGTSAGILKTVPKYCTAVLVKDYMESVLPQPDETSPTFKQDRLWRSATKSAAAGVAGAALTNPLDVIRNEMFKTNLTLKQTIHHLYEELGYSFLWRGMGKNMVAVAIPVACTIFFTDQLIQMTNDRKRRKEVKT